MSALHSSTSTRVLVLGLTKWPTQRQLRNVIKYELYARSAPSRLPRSLYILYSSDIELMDHKVDGAYHAYLTLEHAQDAHALVARSDPLYSNFARPSPMKLVIHLTYPPHPRIVAWPHPAPLALLKSPMRPWPQSRQHSFLTRLPACE